MKLCMFHPLDHPMERGWVGRVDGDHVVQLAAQTLQSFFTGGGSAREHAVYPAHEVRLLAPVLHPPSVRVFEDQATFAFANPAAVVGPGAEIAGRMVIPRLAAVIGAEEELAGFTILAEWRRPDRSSPKDRDFAHGLGPVVVTADEFDPDDLDAVVRVNGGDLSFGPFAGFDWGAARERAADGTRLYAGDLLAGPPLVAVDVAAAAQVEIVVSGLGVLEQAVAP